jgi:hypothetical protein
MGELVTLMCATAGLGHDDRLAVLHGCARDSICGEFSADDAAALVRLMTSHFCACQLIAADLIKHLGSVSRPAALELADAQIVPQLVLLLINGSPPNAHRNIARALAQVPSDGPTELKSDELCRILRSDSKEGHTVMAAKALAIIAELTPLKVAEAGAIPPLVALLTSCRTEVQAEAAIGLARIARVAPLKVAEAGAILLLVMRFGGMVGEETNSSFLHS